MRCRLAPGPSREAVKEEPSRHVKVRRRSGLSGLENLGRQRAAQGEARGANSILEGAKEAKVDEDASALCIFGDDEVSRVDIKMEDAARVEILQGIEEVEDGTKEVSGRGSKGRSGGKGSAANVLAGVVRDAAFVGIAEVEGGGDLRMPQRSEGLKLPLKHQDSVRREAVGAEDLQSHFLPALFIEGEVDGPHAARAELP